MLRTLLTSLMLISSVAYALPTDHTATAEIINNRVDEARQQAIDSAVSSAILQQGGQVNVSQRSDNGVLQPSQLQWRGQGQVRSVELLSETIDGDRITVNVRIDLDQQQLQACDGRGTKAKILIPRPQVRYRQQLVIGGLYELDQAIGRVLSNTLNGEGHYAFAEALPQLNVDLEQSDRQWIRALGQQQAGQYVLALMVDDVAAEQPKKTLGLFDRTGQRTIALHATLYDGFTNKVVWQQRYRSQGEWPYKRQEIADTATERFWNSGFGDEVRRLLMQMSQDIDGQLQCQPLKGRISELRGDQALLDIGSDHGLKLGDTVSAMPQQLQWGNSTAVTLQITQLRPDQAMATVQGNGTPQGIQTGDWVEFR